MSSPDSVVPPWRAAGAGVKACAAVVLFSSVSFAQGASPVLTLKDAERQAIEHNPQIRAGQYSALAATENIREARSAYFPTASASLTGAGAIDGTRIAAGGLNNPIILDRMAAGFS